MAVAPDVQLRGSPDAEIACSTGSLQLGGTVCTPNPKCGGRKIEMPLVTTPSPLRRPNVPQDAPIVNNAARRLQSIASDAEVFETPSQPPQIHGAAPAADLAGVAGEADPYFVLDTAEPVALAIDQTTSPAGTAEPAGLASNQTVSPAGPDWYGSTQDAFVALQALVDAAEPADVCERHPMAEGLPGAQEQQAVGELPGGRCDEPEAGLEDKWATEVALAAAFKVLGGPEQASLDAQPPPEAVDGYATQSKPALINPGPDGPDVGASLQEHELEHDAPAPGSREQASLDVQLFPEAVDEYATPSNPALTNPSPPRSFGPGGPDVGASLQEHELEHGTSAPECRGNDSAHHRQHPHATVTVEDVAAPAALLVVDGHDAVCVGEGAADGTEAPAAIQCPPVPVRGSHAQASIDVAGVVEEVTPGDSGTNWLWSQSCPTQSTRAKIPLRHSQGASDGLSSQTSKLPGLTWDDYSIFEDVDAICRKRPGDEDVYTAPTPRPPLTDGSQIDAGRDAGGAGATEGLGAQPMMQDVDANSGKRPRNEDAHRSPTPRLPATDGSQADAGRDAGGAGVAKGLGAQPTMLIPEELQEDVLPSVAVRRDVGTARDACGSEGAQAAGGMWVRPGCSTRGTSRDSWWLWLALFGDLLLPVPPAACPPKFL